MEGLRGVFSCGGGGRKAALETEELQEEDVWAVMKGREDSNSNSKTRKNYATGPSSSPSSAWRLACRTPRSIPRATADGGGNQDFSATKRLALPQSTSAPVDIPDWSKILKKGSKKNLWDDACDADDNDDDGYGDHGGRRFRHDTVGKLDHGDDDDDDGHEMVPPHEYLARRVATTQIASFSMLEGVGRTLKGRDLSKLRNAILTKTGFIE